MSLQRMHHKLAKLEARMAALESDRRAAKKAGLTKDRGRLSGMISARRKWMLGLRQLIESRMLRA